MRLLFALVLTVVSVTPVEAAHIAGHYGGVPMVQPAPLPWQPQPYQPPVYGAPPAQPRIVVPAPGGPAGYPQRPTLGDPRPYRRTAPNVCTSLLCD